MKLKLFLMLKLSYVVKNIFLLLFDVLLSELNGLLKCDLKVITNFMVIFLEYFVVTMYAHP